MHLKEGPAARLSYETKKAPEKQPQIPPRKQPRGAKRRPWLKAGDGVLFFADGCLSRMKSGFRHHERIAVPRQEEVS